MLARRPDPSAQQVVDLNNKILEANGISLSKESAILDFGCGSGRHVKEYLAAGYSNVYGYDAGNYSDLPSDRVRIDKIPAPNSTGYIFCSGIPWPDGSFDFVYANQVFEHLADQDACYREIARVLKPGGIFLNVHPSKWRPIEPHIEVPFGGAFRSVAYYKPFVALGLCHPSFRKSNPEKSAKIFHDAGINYPTSRETLTMAGKYFSSVTFVERDLIKFGAGKSRKLAPIVSIPGAIWLYRLLHTTAVLTIK